jgi:hypothetical protein
MSRSSVRKVDHTGLKTGMAITIVLLIVGFIVNSWLLVAFVAIAQLLAGIDAPFAPYRLIYQRVVKPSGIVKPHVVDDNPEPHRFAMLVGGILNGVATVLLITGVPVAAWVLVAIVVALANLNFWLNFCLGCWMYYQFNRIGVPGFTVSPLSQ